MKKFKIVSKWGRISFVVSMALLLSASSALATLDTDSASFGDAAGEVPDYSTTVSLSTYSGTDQITGITITVDVSAWDAWYFLDNDSSSATDADVDMTFDIEVGLPTSPVGSSSQTVSWYSDTISLLANDGDSRRSLDVDLGGDYHEEQVGTDSSPVAFSVTFTIASSDFDSYTLAGTGSSTFDVDLDVLFNYLISASVQSSVIVPLLNGKVTADYSTIPEPVTMALLGVGGLLVRRRK